MHDFISKSLIFRVQNFAKFEGGFSLGFYVESDFQKTHQVAFRTTISIQNLHSFYRAKTDLKFALIFWGKDSWKENDGWIDDEFLYLTNTVSFLSIGFEKADFEAGCICSF